MRLVSPAFADQSTQPHSLPSGPASSTGPRSSSADCQVNAGRRAASVRISVALGSRGGSVAVERSMKATSTRSSGTPTVRGERLERQMAGETSKKESEFWID